MRKGRSQKEEGKRIQLILKGGTVKLLVEMVTMENKQSSI